MSRSATWLAPIVLLAIILCVWTVAAASVSPLFLPGPVDVAKRGGEIVSQGWFWGRTLTTLYEAILGSLLGAAIAIPTSWAIHCSKLVGAALQPFLGASQAIPAIAIAPLLVLWIGRGPLAIMSLCALMVFFPILVSTTVGLRHLDPDVIDAASLDGASGWRLIWSVEAPLVMPSLLSGVRNGFTLSITGAVVGEMVMGGQGLGQLLVQQQHNVDIAGMFVTVIALAALAMTLYSLVYYAETRGKDAVGVERRKKRRSK